MAETQANATPPASSGAPLIDLEKLGAVISKAVSEQVAAAIKPLADGIASLSATKEKGLTAADVEKMVGEKLTAQAATVEQAAARKAFLAEKMKDVPEVYQGQLGNDPAKWAAEEQAIRGKLKADLDLLGVKKADVGAGTTSGAAPSTKPDYSKMSGPQRFSAGFAELRKVGEAQQIQFERNPAIAAAEAKVLADQNAGQAAA